MALPFGIIISILCLTGGILVFRTELQELFHHDRYYVDEVKDSTIPLEELLPMVQKVVPEIEFEAVFTSTDKSKTYTIDLQNSHDNSIEVDPYTGKIKAIVIPGKADEDVFFDVVSRLHQVFLFRTAQGEFSWGRFITGVATLVFGFILLTGIIIWAPKKIKNIKERLKINLKKGGFRFWYDTHLACGIVSAIFLLVMVLTALDSSFGWYHRGFYALFGAPVVQRVARQQPSSGRQQTQTTRQRPVRTFQHYSAEELPQMGKALDVALAELKHDHPDATNISFKLGRPGSEGLGFVSTNNGKTNNEISYNAGTGSIDKFTPFKNLATDRKLEWLITSIHTGRWGGIFSKTLYLLATLIGTILPITGYYFYFRKVTKKSKNKNLI